MSFHRSAERLGRYKSAKHKELHIQSIVVVPLEQISADRIIMKCLVIAILACTTRTFLVNGLQSGGPVNLNRLPLAYVEGASLVDVPILEKGVSSDSLRNGMLRTPRDFLRDLIRGFYRQATDEAKKFVTGVKEHSTNLKNGIRDIEHNGLYRWLDTDLTALTNLFKVFYSCRPGNVPIDRPNFAAMPVSPAKVVSRTTARTAPELFTKLATIIDGDCLYAYGIADKIYAAGWANARKQFEAVQKDIRDRILNGRMLIVARAAAHSLLKKRDTIMKHVSLSNWFDFEVVANQIVGIPTEFAPTLFF